jgi:hypothetical protein
MKYRIKVFPYKGRLWYMPQLKGWFSWHDEFISRTSIDNSILYDRWQLDYMRSESDCLDWIRREVDDKNKKKQDATRIKKFEQDNPAYYIKVDLIKDNND